MIKATAGTALARFYNETDGAPVVDSELSSTSGTFERQRSTSAFALVNGKEYRVQMGSDAGDGGNAYGAKLINI